MGVHRLLNQLFGVPKPVHEGPHPFPDDKLCRDAGLKIHGRPDVGPAIWRTAQGRLLPQHEAVAFAKLVLAEKDVIVTRERP